MEPAVASGDGGRRRSPRPAPWGATATRDEARSYLEQRLILLSQLMFWVFLVLEGFVVIQYEAYPETRPAHAAIVHWFAAAGLGGLAAVWYFALRRGRCSIEVLYFIDAVFIAVVGLAFGVAAYFGSDHQANVYAAFIWHTFMVTGRVLIIPSTARRTAVVSALSFVPLGVASIVVPVQFPDRIDLPSAALIAGTFIFAAVAVIIATTGSRVIYGLRRRVDQAMQLGQYTLGDKIGEGGMGAVYHARHAMLRRPTAIKLLPPDRHDAESMLRFEREVQATSRLTHPNTVAIYDYGRSPDGVFYYAMEYLDGIDLEALVSRYGAQPAGRVVSVLTQVCGALDEAHQAGLIHRDIKPANIILCRRGLQADVVKVVDFGLVKEIVDGGDVETSSVIAGTPAYLAPEMVVEPELVGPRSDLYSLAAVGYFLLTGVPPFTGPTALSIAMKHVTDPPEPPSRRTANPVPAELEQLLLACMAKQPDQRPDSAAALAAALSAIECEGWDDPVARAWWREHDASVAVPVDTAPTLEAALTINVDLSGR